MKKVLKVLSWVIPLLFIALMIAGDILEYYGMSKEALMMSGVAAFAFVGLLLQMGISTNRLGWYKVQGVVCPCPDGWRRTYGDAFVFQGTPGGRFSCNSDAFVRGLPAVFHLGHKGVYGTCGCRTAGFADIGSSQRCRGV